MLKRTAKTARTKRFLEEKEPKANENPKASLIIRGSTANQTMNSLIKDINLLKKPHSVLQTRKNKFHPFEDITPLESLSEKFDASLFCFASHSKKRPQNLTIGRMFHFQLYDMIEIGVENYKSIVEFKGKKCGMGLKPCFVFNGSEFTTDPDCIFLKGMFIDFFRGEQVDQINVAGLEHVIVVSVVQGKLSFRAYAITLNKTGLKVPRVELEEMGPSFDFSIRRTRQASDEMIKEAKKVPRVLKPKKAKNVSKDDMGDVFGRVHLGRQDLSTLQTRKMKALKRKREESEESEGSQLEFEEAEEAEAIEE